MLCDLYLHRIICGGKLVWVGVNAAREVSGGKMSNPPPGNNYDQLYHKRKRYQLERDTL